VKISKLLTARSTVITLLGAISVALLIASAVPQRTSLGGGTPQWVARLPQGLGFLSSLLKLDNVVGSSWFALLVGIFWLSLLISTVNQFGATRSLAARIPAPEIPAGAARVDLDPETLARRIKAAGYHPAGEAPGVRRYVKNRVGYWGNFLLHIGLVTAVIFSLVYVLTQHRVQVRLTGEEITVLGPETVQEVKGVLPLSQELPRSVVLKGVQPAFWGNDKLESLASELYFTARPGDEPRRVNVALSDKSQFGPYLVYQANVFGRSFDLELQSAEGSHRLRLYLPYPLRRDLAGYGEMAVPGTDFLLKGKFYADRGKKSMQLNQPPLTLRLYRGRELLQQAALEPGTPAQLGPFAVRLEQSAWWTEILLDGSRGTAGIFAGFAVILAGVLSSYCLVPREVVVRRRGDDIYLQQVVRRFASFYREEFDDLIQTVKKPGEP
jgi:cytochrome c biogenesis protein